MAEPLRRSPADPDLSAERALPNAEGRPLPKPEEQIYVVERRSAMERTASQAGSVLGRAIRSVQEKLTRPGQPGAADKVRVIADRRRAQAQEFGELAAARAQEWIHFLRERSLELRERAQDRWAYWREERPIQVAIGAGAVGFLVGVALRLRRAHNAER
jgi:hypothetical protein